MKRNRDIAVEKSSPHTRGCFLVINRLMKSVPVFPAYAGVFLPALGLVEPKAGLPRIRGGVSTSAIRGLLL